MKRFLEVLRFPSRAALFIALSVSLLLSPLLTLSAHATSVYDTVIKSTDEVHLSKSGCTTLDLSYSYMQYIGASTNSNLIAFKDQILSQTSGWAVFEGNTGADEVYVLLGSQDSTYTLTTNSSGTKGIRFDSTSQIKEAILRFDSSCNVIVSYSTGSYNFSLLDSDSAFISPYGNGTMKFLFFNAPFIAPSGYAGVSLPDHLSPPTIPEFGYTIKEDNTITFHYLRNLELDSQFSWHYQLYEADSNYVKGTKVDDQTKGLIFPYTYTVASHGYYVMEISLYVPAPFTDPDPPVKNVTFKLNIDGNFHLGSSTIDDCTDGVCTQPVVDCDFYTSPMSRMSCELERSMSIGLLNPSINAFKDLFNSFLIPTTPTCGFSLPNPSVDGKVIAISSLPSVACSKSHDFQDEFPIYGVIVNLGFALLILYMLVGIINRLTNNDKNDMIEGIN